MKVTAYCKTFFTDTGIVLIPSEQEFPLIKKLYDRLQRKGDKEYYIQATLSIPSEAKTYKQVNTLWALITIIFESQNGRKPTDEEKYSLYLDILDAYADRTVNKLTGTSRPVHLSESNVTQAAKLIQACFDLIVDMCDLDLSLQADVRELFWEWQKWRGSLKSDPIDYRDEFMTEPITDEEWREIHKISDASGKGGIIEKAHIVSKGANIEAIDEPWNWLALTREEHMIQHTKGWEHFLSLYPHLKGRVDRARRMASCTNIHTF